VVAEGAAGTATAIATRRSHGVGCEVVALAAPPAERAHAQGNGHEAADEQHDDRHGGDVHGLVLLLGRSWLCGVSLVMGSSPGPSPTDL
jgi:hypothetical protein